MRFTASTASANVNSGLPSCGRRFHNRFCLLSPIRANASLLIPSTELTSHCHDWLAPWKVGASVTGSQATSKGGQDDNQFPALVKRGRARRLLLRTPRSFRHPVMR